MAGADQKEILKKIQDTYVPFLKKFIAFLESKKTAPANLGKVKAVYTIFTTAPPDEQVETFNDNKKKLEDWYKKAEKKKRTTDESDDKSAQDAPETAQPPAKKRSAKSKEKNQEPAENNSTPVEEPLVFACASCDFSTQEDEEFIKHARSDHRSELSMWCKQCEKSFTNATLLVTHLKNRACVKEEMVYKCGVKDCSFETPTGQTFAFHLRHTHKGFLHCFHCQKFFTLPHCLILHIQDECQFKDNFRKSGASATSSQPTSVPKSAPTKPMIQPQASAAAKAPASRRGRVSTAPTRGRGRGRGRGRPTSNEVEDVDDPGYCPKTSVADTGVRRSGRRAVQQDVVVDSE